MPHTVTIEATAAGLNQFCNRFSPKIHQILKTGLELESMLPAARAEYAYTGQDVVMSSLLQPYQHAFTPNNTEAFDGITSYLRPIKADLQFTAEQLEKFFDKWKCNWADKDPNDIRSNYAGYILGQHVLPQLTEELNQASWAGAYVAPTPGTAGAVLASVDGFAESIADQITAGRLTPINTGVWVDTTTVAQVRTFCEGIPFPYRYKQGIILCSKTRAQKYSDDYKAKYPSREFVEKTPDGLYMRVDDFNKVIMGVTAMEGSNRIICIFPDLESMIVVKHFVKPDFFQFRFQEFDRTLKVFGEIYRAYSMETCLHMFVNEQV